MELPSRFFFSNSSSLFFIACKQCKTHNSLILVRISSYLMGVFFHIFLLLFSFLFLFLHHRYDVGMALSIFSKFIMHSSKFLGLLITWEISINTGIIKWFGFTLTMSKGKSLNFLKKNQNENCSIGSF